MKRRAFTLIELLVVVAIIATLISILMPSLGRARDQAKSVACLSNLKALGMLNAMYAGDYNGWAVCFDNTSAQRGNWADVWMRLKIVTRGRVLSCPSQPPFSAYRRDGKLIVDGDSIWSTVDGNTIYGAHGCPWKGEMAAGYRSMYATLPSYSFEFYNLLRHPQPDALIVFADSAGDTTTPTQNYTLNGSAGGIPLTLHLRHQSCVNAVIGDGSARPLSKNDLRYFFAAGCSVKVGIGTTGQVEFVPN